KWAKDKESGATYGVEQWYKWRSGKESDDDDDDGDVETDDNAGFDVVKPRPVRQPAQVPAATDTSSAATEGATFAGKAATVGESTEIVTAAETAAEVAAPEVAVPVAAAVAAAHHLPKPRRAHGRPPAETNPPPVEPPPDPADSLSWSSGDYARSDASLPPIAPRPASASRRTVLPPLQPAPKQTPEAAAPSSVNDSADPDAGAPLEFPPAPTARPANSTPHES
ncbi:MAG: hypothetical protein K2X97_16435, partial [Mycobacteriaceae bacterium]|nr:hypothetical protein [Mycobacteriaceae bacterium]